MSPLRPAAAAALIALLLLGALAGPALGADRFPRPEFESGHALPATAAPGPRAAVWEIADTAVLVGALGLAGYLALRRRSRRGLMLLSIFSLLYFGFWRRGCVCPVGAVQDAALALSDPTYAMPLVVLAFLLVPLAFTLFFGRTFCAAVCPLGAIQDLVALRPQQLPLWLCRALGMLAPVYLGLAVLLAALGSGFLICRYDPFVGFFRMSAPVGMLALGAGFLAVGVFVARPYCRFLCPYGVLLGWASRLSKWHVSIAPDQCIRCRLCATSCPFGAIRPPDDDGAEGGAGTGGAEPRPTAGRRLAFLLAALPLLAGLGGWSGRLLAVPLARMNPTTSLARQIAREEAAPGVAMTLESEAFRSTGRPIADLYREAAAVNGRTRLGATILGALLGLAFGLKLIDLSVRRPRTEYGVDRAACLSCGRCFAYCPLDRGHGETQS